MTKQELQKWVRAQDLRMREKAVLGRLAAFAQQNSFEVWALVKKLAKDVGASERTVQSALRVLRERGLIEPTGRYHKHLGGRWVPVYRIAALTKPDQSLTVRIVAPIDPQPVHPSLGANLHPDKREKGVEETSEEVSFESYGFKTAFSVYPRSINTRRAEASKAWAKIASGIEERLLIQAVWTFAGEWKKHQRTFNVRGLQRWLSEGDYENYLPQPTTAQVLSAGNIPDQLLRAFAQEVCPDLSNKYLRYANLDDKRLRPASNYARDELSRAGRRFFSERGIVILNADGSPRG